jgi:hemerythrin-like domain-containing protein
MSIKSTSIEDAPIRAVSNFIHTAILREARFIVDEAARLDSAAAAAKLATRVAIFSERSHQHTDGEEKGVFTFIAKRWPGNEKHYLCDHQEERALFRKAESSLQEAAAAGASQGAFEEARRAIALVTQHLSLHVRKEDEILFGMITDEHGPEEQRNIVRRILATYTPDDVAEVVPWMMNLFNADEREAFVRMRMAFTPGPDFVAVMGFIKNGIPVDAWTDLARRVPELNV